MRHDILTAVVLTGALLCAVTCVADPNSARTPHPVIEAASSEIPVDRPWYVCPSTTGNLDPAGYYPIRAQRLGIRGSVDIECRLPANATKVKACAWITETPPDYGFGDMAAKLGCFIHPHVKGPQPDASEDRIFKTTVNFRLPGSINHGDHGERR